MIELFDGYVIGADSRQFILKKKTNSINKQGKIIYKDLSYHKMLYKKYDITMPKQSLFRNISGRLFWLLVSLVPGLRLIFVLLIAYGYSEKEKEFKLQSGDMR